MPLLPWLGAENAPMKRTEVLRSATAVFVCRAGQLSAATQTGERKKLVSDISIFGERLA
jgi:hypothetical protein